MNFLLTLLIVIFYVTHLYCARDVFSAKFINRIRMVDNNISNIETLSDLDALQYEHIFDDYGGTKFKVQFGLSYGRRTLSEDARLEARLKELAFHKRLFPNFDVFIGTLYLKMFKRNILYQYDNPWEAFFIKTSFRGLGVGMKIAECDYFEFYSGLGPRQWEPSEETGIAIIRNSFHIKPVEASVGFCWISNAMLKHYYLLHVAHNVNGFIRYTVFGSVTYSDTKYDSSSFSLQPEFTFLGGKILSKAIVEANHYIRQKNMQFNYGVELVFASLAEMLKNLSLSLFFAKITSLATSDAIATFDTPNLVYKLCFRYTAEENIYFDTYYLRKASIQLLVNELVVKF